MRQSTVSAIRGNTDQAAALRRIWDHVSDLAEAAEAGRVSYHDLRQSLDWIAETTAEALLDAVLAFPSSDLYPAS